MSVSAVTLSLSLIFILCVAALSQGIPSTQLYGGFSYEAIHGPDNTRSDLLGWNASFAVRVYRPFSIVADFGGHYGSINEVVDVRMHTFLFGPKVTLHSGRIAPFIHSLFGVSWMEANSGGPTLSQNAATVAVGGGVDLKMYRGLSIRLFQGEYLRRRF